MPVAAMVLFSPALPAIAQEVADFHPIAEGEVYQREFLDDFFNALGSRPGNATWIEESETVRLLVTGGMHAERGEADQAILTFDIIPDQIASAFPFLTTMREDLLVPEILEPWYDVEQAREMLFQFYEDSWLPHPEYRDDYITFRDDTMGRASRRDPNTPAVWILGHLSDYGFVPDQQLTEDDPYLFLWDLLTGVTYYAQRATFYGLEYDCYDENQYKRAVVARVGEIIRGAHSEASRREMGRGFWADLISSHHPFETPTAGVETTGEISPPEGTRPTSQTTATQPTVSTVPETDHSAIFRPPVEISEEDKAERIERLIQRLIERVEGEVEEAAREEEIPQEAVEEVVEEVPEIEEETSPDVTEEAPAEEEIPGGTPDEFMVETPSGRTPSEMEPEAGVPVGLGNYAEVRLKELADQLAVDIGALAEDLGRETIDLVVLYNDQNVSEETIVNAEDRYIAKREEFLAGLAVWDRFNMEIYTPLTLADFNDLVVADLRSPYNEVKSNATQWAQYRAFESHFEEAFGQIENGIRNRRDEPDVLEAEQAALTAFLGEYNDLIKEIEDLLSGAITEPPEESEPE